jgi:hypothetical protein
MNRVSILLPSSVRMNTRSFTKYYIYPLEVLFVFRSDVSEASVFVFMKV